MQSTLRRTREGDHLLVGGRKPPRFSPSKSEIESSDVLRLGALVVREPGGRCQGCNHAERVRIERFLAAGASIKGAARKFEIDYHALRRHWMNHVSPEARAAYVVGAGAIKDQLEEIVADESLAL